MTREGASRSPQVIIWPVKFKPKHHDRTARVVHYAPKRLEPLIARHRWEGELLPSDPGLVAFAPDDVSKRYAPLVLRPIGGQRGLKLRPEIAWTYLADTCLKEPVLVGGQTLAERGKEPRLFWQDGWRAEVVEGEPQAVGEWINKLGLHVWAPILSSVEELRVLGATEEHHRLTVRASEFARMTRDRLITACDAAGMHHGEIARRADISRRRVDQLLRDEQRRAQVRAGPVAAMREAITPHGLEQLGDELEAACNELIAMTEREVRSRNQRREAHRAVHELGFSQGEVATLLGISKPRVQQLRVGLPTRIGPLELSAE